VHAGVCERADKRPRKAAELCGILAIIKEVLRARRYSKDDNQNFIF